MKKPGLKTDEVRQRLRDRYAPPEYAFFEEVADGTGFQVSRHLDAMAFSLWPSRGLTITGFEIKVSRADWLKELKQPEKAEALAAYCDYFYLVVGDRSIVFPGELPDAWGLIAPFGQKLKIEKEAPRTDAIPLDRSFLMAIARKSHETASAKLEIERLRNVHRSELSAQYQKGREAGKSEANPGLYQKYKTLHDQVDRFKAISGIDVNFDWDSSWPEDIGKAIKAIRRNSTYEAKHLRDTAAQLETLARAFESSFEIPMIETSEAAAA